MKITTALLFTIINISALLAGQEINDLKKQIQKSYFQHNYTEAIAKSNFLIERCLQEKNQIELQYAYENLGIFYSDICDYKTAMKFYSKALKLIDVKKDHKKYNSINLNIGTTLLEANNNKEAIYYLNKAKKYFTSKQNSNFEFQIVCYANLGIAYKNLHQLSQAKEYNEKALQIAKEHFLLDRFSGTLINLGDIYFELNEIEKAHSNYNDAIFYFEKSNDQLGLWHAKIGIANIYAFQNKYKESNQINLQASKYFSTIHNLKDLVTCYSNLSKGYYSLKDYNQAYLFKNKELTYIELLRNEENQEAISNFKLQHEIESTNEKIKIKNALIQKEKKISYLLYFSIGLLFILLLFIVRTYKMRQKMLQRKNIENQKIAALDKDVLTKKLNHTEQELETFALHIIQKNEFIEEFKEDFRRLKKGNPQDLMSQITSLQFKLNNVFKKNKEFEIFLKRVEEVNSNFYHLLDQKFPNLTQKEKKLCALIKLNLSSKDIALLTNVSLGAITMARYRLRTKINLDKDENLTEFLVNLV